MISETAWYEPEQKPVYKGVYKRTSANGTVDVNFSYWNGVFFGCLAPSVDGAVSVQHISSCVQSLPWCGLTEQAK